MNAAVPDRATLEVTAWGHPVQFLYRPGSAGDVGVIDQVFQHRSYDVTNWAQGVRLMEYHAHFSHTRPSLIVDAGANIGASALFFLANFQNTSVIALEPDLANFELLEANTSGFANKLNLHAALASGDGWCSLQDPGHSDWGFRTSAPQAEAPAEGMVRTFSVPTLLSSQEAAGHTPLILKIDIEGAEQEVFREGGPWLDLFALVTIELHDWMLPFSGSSRGFLKAIAALDFDVILRGENLFCFNRRLLAS